MATNCVAFTGGATLPALAAYLKALGAWDALTLDGSGSSQFFYRGPDGTITASQPSDLRSDLIARVRLYRPIPIFLGFR